MKIRNLVVSLVLLTGFVQAQSLPKVCSGSIQRLESFPSKFVEARNVDVWLPDGHDQSKKYGVVYMHDGQNLFDSLQTWNRKEWGVDETFSRLMKKRKDRSMHSGRHLEYRWKPNFGVLTG
jgi:hypothetical protein